MPAVKKLPDRTILARLRRQGWTQREIADTYGVTQAAVHKALSKADLDTGYYSYRDLLPWDVAPEHLSVSVMHYFRSILKQRRGIELRPEEERSLNAWLKDLRDSNLVVTYHKDAPPNSASRKGGFYYVERSDRDDWIIRQPELS